jgi:O-antigen/teichoic acid export membrane protein
LRQFGQGAVISVSTLLIQLVLTVLFVWVLHWGVEGALSAVILTNAIMLLVLLGLLRKYHGLTWARPSLRRMAEAWSFGVRYYVGKISNLANIQIGTLIVAMFVGKEEIGVFAVAAGLVVQTETIPNVLGTVIMPRVAADAVGRPELVAQCARISAIACGLLLGILAIFTVPIVKILFSPDFLPAVLLIRIIAIGTLIRCASKVVVPYLIRQNHPGTASLAVFTGMGVNFGAMFWLLPVLGLAGAAVSMSMNYLVSSAILLIAFAWISKMPQREFWRFRKDDFSSLTDAIRRLRKKASPAPPNDSGTKG